MLNLNYKYGRIVSLNFLRVSFEAFAYEALAY